MSQITNVSGKYICSFGIPILSTYFVMLMYVIFGSFCVKYSVVTNALSFYVTKTVLVSPKWFWSDQIDLDLTKTILD